MIFTYFLCFSLTTQQQFQNTTLNMDNLSLRNILTIKEAELSEESCFTFGIWSKYSPLNIKGFKDQIGMFQSNCYQLINVMEYTTKSLYFIYYVCLEYSTKRIVKTIQFVNDQDQSIQFDKSLDPYEFENIWYQFQLISWPILRRLELIIIKSDKIILKEIITDIKPFKEQQLLLTFGDNLEVIESRIDQITQGMMYSLFPGQIVVYHPLIEIIPISFDFEQQIIEGYSSLTQCNCQNNEQVDLEEIGLNVIDDKIYISENVNCNYYALSGWLKVKDIVQKSEEFTYQFIKMTVFIGKQQIFNENVATFQMFYQISTLSTKIIIKTYTYDFPIAIKEIQDVSQEIETQFQIQKDNLKQWHYLFLQLEDNQFNIKITFYDYQSNIQFYEAQFSVRQFHNCQFKLQYGNIQKNSLNYLKIELRKFQFTNCQYDERISKCHSSCLDCDGSNKNNCLSCPVEQQRIYIPEFKQCLCPYSTIDYDNKCITYEDSNLLLKVKQNINKKCKAGYFELEGDCERCPSRVKADLITCFDCFSQGKDWASKSICGKYIYFPISLSLQNAILYDYSFQYYHDGSDLIICENCLHLDYEQELQNEDGIYKLFLQKFNGFESFCFSLIDFGSEQKCTICNVGFCILCGIQIDGIVCLKCEENYIVVDGLCKFNKQIPYFYQSCQPPYYTTYNRECKICPINYCLYCFEYNYNNNKESNTLSQAEILILEEGNSYVKIGCVLCQDGYIFNFNSGLCVNQVPRIQYCLTSYIKQLDEKCLLSTLNNFEVSRVINNCDDYILNCEICALYYQQVIICINCKIGFVLQEGLCYMNEESKINYSKDIWDLQIKAFLLIYQFDKSQDYPNKEPSKCGNSCLSCKNDNQQYFCEKCMSNHLEDPVRIQYGLYCPECPRLCQVCISRPLEEIKLKTI